MFVCVQFVRGSLERSDAEIASSYAALGVDKLLLPHPTVDNPRNVLDIMLQSRMYSVSRRGFKQNARVLVTAAVPAPACEAVAVCGSSTRSLEAVPQSSPTHQPTHLSSSPLVRDEDSHVCVCVACCPVQEWLGAFMVWAEEVASETTSPSILRIAAAVQRSMPPAPGQDPEAESLVPEDDGLTLCLVLSAPSYGPLQRTCATIDVAFVQYSDGVLG